MKTISQERHLQALGLFTMAAHHFREAEHFRQGLMRLLNVEGALGSIDDAIFDLSRQRPEHLNEALKAEGFVVEECPAHHG